MTLYANGNPSMSAPQTITISHAGQPPLTLTILEDARLRFYRTVFSDRPDGSGWAQTPAGRYWRLDVPPSVYHALTVGDACGVLWQDEEILGAMDWDAREQEPNATAYHIDPEIAGGHITELEGQVTCTSNGKPALLGRVDADPDDEWWLVVLD
jgi:hypothetical protein